MDIFFKLKFWNKQRKYLTKMLVLKIPNILTPPLTNTDVSEESILIFYACILIDWSNIGFRLVREYFTHLETSPLLLKGSKVSAHARRFIFWAGSDLTLPYHICYVSSGPWFRWTAPCSRLLRQAGVRYRGTILIRISTKLDECFYLVQTVTFKPIIAF